MPRHHQRSRFVSMLFANAIERSPPPCLRAGIEALEGRAATIRHTEMPERSGLGLPRLARCRDMIGYGGSISTDELIRAESRSDADLAASGHANINADVTVSVDILDQMLEPKLHRLPHHTATSSQGLPLSRSGSASKARPRAKRSQTVRLVSSLGPAMQPSLTIMSNRLGPAPTQAAAW